MEFKLFPFSSETRYIPNQRIGISGNAFLAFVLSLIISIVSVYIDDGGSETAFLFACVHICTRCYALIELSSTGAQYRQGQNLSD